MELIVNKHEGWLVWCLTSLMVDELYGQGAQQLMSSMSLINSIFNGIDGRWASRLKGFHYWWTDICDLKVALKTENLLLNKTWFNWLAVLLSYKLWQNYNLQPKLELQSWWWWPVVDNTPGLHYQFIKCCTILDFLEM